MFEIKFTLKQHTPIIHFQHDQAGATLRATEVKAKLDKHLWEKAWTNRFEEGKLFLVGYSPDKLKDIKKRFEDEQFRALDYKINFEAHDNQVNSIPDRMPLFFGNMGSDGGDKKEKRFVMAKGEITGRIVSSDPELVTLLKKHLSTFFQSQNFGTRQNKGFGSFQITRLNGKEIGFESPSKYCFKIEDSTDLGILLDNIDLFYRSLRSGINLKGGGQSDKLYFKSLLFQYAKTQQHQWDKRKVRLDLFKHHPKFQEIERNRSGSEDPVHYNQGTPMLYRDMLGLSSSQSWLSYRATVTKEHISANKDDKIDRFKSPITFKPFRTAKGWKVYIILSTIPEEMKNTAFLVESGDKTTTLFTPNFRLEQYLKFAFNYFTDDHSVEDYVGDHVARREVRILQNIYQQLSEQI